MSGIEDFIKRKTEFKKSYEGLKNEPNLISFDGPDGSGKTEISEKVVRKLKEKFKKEGKNPDDVVYLKYTSLIDTDSQKNITSRIKECKDEKTGSWDKNKINRMLTLWSTKLNRSYNDHILPLIKQGKVIVLDRSEIDVLRACLEWGNKELLEKITEYMKNGTLTHGIVADNRIFVSSLPEDAYRNLTERKEPLSENDPKSLEDARAMAIKQEGAEKLILEIHGKEPNVIRVKNIRIEDGKERDAQLEQIAEEIISKLQLQ